MRYFYLSVTLLAAFVSVASAQNKPPQTPKSLGLPEGTSPMLGFYQGVDQKEKTIKFAFIDSMPEVTPKVVKKNGVEETVFEDTFKPFLMSNGVPMADVKFYNVAGQKLTTESVLARLKVNDTIVVSGDEQPIAAAYLKVIRPDAIIAIFPLDAFIEPLVDQAFPLVPPGDAPPVPFGPAPPAPRPR